MSHHVVPWTHSSNFGQDIYQVHQWKPYIKQTANAAIIAICKAACKYDYLFIIHFEIVYTVVYIYILICCESKLKQQAKLGGDRISSSIAYLKWEEILHTGYKYSILTGELFWDPRKVRQTTEHPRITQMTIVLILGYSTQYVPVWYFPCCYSTSSR